MPLISITNRIVLRIIISLLLLSLPLGALAQFHEKKILMIIPSKDFWDEELMKPKEIFELKGFLVTVASSAMKETKGMFGTKIKPDVVLNKVKAVLYDAIVFVGGEGAVKYWDDPHAHRLVKEALKKGKILGAISIAPIILANAKVLLGKKATVWPTWGKRLKWAGAIYTGEPVEVDGKIVTANSPGAAEEFARTVLRTIAQ